MSLVLDASMTLAFLLEDERNTAADAVLDRVIAQGALVPGHWRLEVASGLKAAARRGRCDPSFLDRSLGRLSDLPIRTDTQTETRAWGETLALSRAENLTLYDAAYLELALREGRVLASADADLLAAAERRAVTVLAA